ncbi:MULTISPECIES: helix-turn-helix domain-containing protein [unclassified Psychrobacter]|uniref:helix-turn-helix domain-containing protein n=1 Tax=unclassified Psychrobacter TaxID=196806 RepID=UPI0018F6F2E5|nr:MULTISPECIES: helix-turn-helix domain-containing protein [unclassified Psychrobacter]
MTAKTNAQQTKQTYCQIIMAHLLAGKTISTYQAFEEYRITCLAQRISDLRASGEPIKSKIVTSDSGKHYAEYWIDDAERLSKGAAA